MSATKFEVRPGVYYDSVVLMQLQKALAELPDILDAGVVMATSANRDLLLAAGFDLTGIEAKADDLLIVVNGENAAIASRAIEQVDDLLKRRHSQAAGDFCPHSLAGALDYLPESNWVLISVPGRYAAGVAEEALDLNQHVFLYSDNVSMADEIALKQKAREKGCSLWGRTVGRRLSTALVWDLPIAFAAGSNWTGSCIRHRSAGRFSAGIHNLGGGISQALGTGGRDLKGEVGGMTTLQGLDLLQRDEQTAVIVLISKPIDPALRQPSSTLLKIQRKANGYQLNRLSAAGPADRQSLISRQLYRKRPNWL